METTVRAQKPMFSNQDLVRLMIPLVIEQLLLMTVGMADTMMVTTAGESVVSGVSLVDNINILIINIFSALSTGGAVVVAQYLGRREPESARSAARQLLYVVLLAALVLMALALFLRGHILRLLFGDITQEVMDSALIYFLLTATLLIITGGLLFILMRQIKRARASERKVKQTAGLQEKYIGHFIELSSTYANRLQTLRKTVGRKIASGQADELLKMIDSGKFNDSQNEEFCTVFDSAFLDLYPDFVEGINNLLRPEERIDSAAAHTLTPELRIYAIVRLGVDESVKIAQILNYSVATVYSYRNRMRNRAISRESFDEDVKRGDFRK